MKTFQEGQTVYSMSDEVYTLICNILEQSKDSLTMYDLYPQLPIEIQEKIQITKE